MGVGAQSCYSPINASSSGYETSFRFIKNWFSRSRSQWIFYDVRLQPPVLLAERWTQIPITDVRETSARVKQQLKSSPLGCRQISGSHHGFGLINLCCFSWQLHLAETEEINCRWKRLACGSTPRFLQPSGSGELRTCCRGAVRRSCTFSTRQWTSDTGTCRRTRARLVEVTDSTSGFHTLASRISLNIHLK